MTFGKINCSWSRVFDKAGPAWLITLSIGTLHGHKSGGEILAAFPQSWAVVDDFGTLVCVEMWR